MRRAWLIAIAVGMAAAAIVVIEWLRPGSARFLECLVLAALGGVSAWAARGGLRNGLVMSCSLLVGLAVLEGGVLFVDWWDGAVPPAAARDSGLSRPRPLVGWGPVKPGVYRFFKKAADGHFVFDTHVTIDSNLNRKTVPSEGEGQIVFFGDSWIYGDGVADSETLPQQFADLEHGRIPVLNLSFGGWSPAQNLIALQKGLYEKLLAKPRHFILFTSPFHLERTACKGSYAFTGVPRFVPDGEGVRFAGPCVAGRTALVPLFNIAKRFALYGRIEPLIALPNHDDVATYLKIVEAFASQANVTYGVKTTILFAHFDDKYLEGSGFTEAQIVEAWRHAGLDVLVDHLPPIPDMGLYTFRGEGHPTALANTARAAEIETHLRQVDPAALDVSATH